MTLPVALHTAAAVRALETRALATPGSDGLTLMRRAGAAALEALRARWPVARDLAVLCGGGNNGGDGWMLARLAHRAGLSPTVWWTRAPDALRDEAADAAREAIAAGVPHAAWTPAVGAAPLIAADVVVDALLGLGATQDVRGPVAAAIAAIDVAGRPVLALDVPSGLCADTGRVLGAAVQADATVTFIALKAGLWLGAGPDHAGEVRLATLGIVDDLAPPAFERLEADTVRALIPPRGRDAHKGQGGHVLVVGGGVGMPGAARLAAEAALRVGAGRVTVACAEASATAVATGRPELMVQALSSQPDAAARQLRARLETIDVLVIGPGLGRDAWAAALLEAALGGGGGHTGFAGPAVIDADALVMPAAACAAPRIYTPHPGEAARLLGTSSTEVQADRAGALQRLSSQLGGVVVLKGAGTLLAQRGSPPTLCERGDPVLAAPGTGDVLAGAIGGLCAQSGDAWAAARAGVWLHARAGERLAQAAHRGVLAGEVAAALPATLAALVDGDER